MISHRSNFPLLCSRVCQEGLWGRTHLGEKGPSLPEQRESFGEVTTPPRWTGPEPALGFGRVNSAASNDLQESFKEGKKILF